MNPPLLDDLLNEIMWKIGILLSFSTSTYAAPPLRVMIDQPPLNLNPRQSMDAISQKMGELLFRGLSRFNVNAQPEDDLAILWQHSKNFTEWSFEVRPQQVDQAGTPIATQDVFECLEQYRTGKPRSTAAANITGWKKTRLNGRRIVLEIEQADPYFKSNASLLKFFRTRGAPPCADPAGEPLIGSGRYQIETQTPSRILLRAMDLKLPSFDFWIVKDEATRVLKLIKKEVDVTQNSLTAPKTLWLKKHTSHYAFFEKTGANVSYLAFNFREKPMDDLRVRQAIALAIDRKSIVDNRMADFGQLAGSFLSPEISGNLQVAFEYNPQKSESLLEEAGYKKSAKGIRLALQFRTTQIKEGYETALILQAMLKKVGIDLQIQQVESTVFFSGLKSSRTHMYVSRWVGVKDPSIFFRTLESKENLNRIGYQNVEVDTLLKAFRESESEAHKTELLFQIQKKMGEEIPYFPLWFWNTSLIVSKDWAQGVGIKDLSLSGSFDIFTRLQRKP